MAKKGKAGLALIFGNPDKGGDAKGESEEEMGPSATELIQEALDSGDPETWKAAIQACVDEGYD